MTSAMRERPILFSASMVRAILGGRKTQTRRAIKWPRGTGPCDPEWCAHPSWKFDDGGHHCATCGAGVIPTRSSDGADYMRCPYGVSGDLLWVKETLRRAPHVWAYAADGAEVGWPARGDLAVKTRDVVTAIHCSRAASRITLRITDVRVERLNEIDDSDAFAEGVALAQGGGFEVPGTICFSGTPRGAYAALWRQINGPDSWDANPRVWAVSFEVLANV